MMRKLHVLFLALVAVCAFGVYSSSAFAASELLANGETISGELAASIAGELLFEDSGAIGTPDILCSGIFDILIISGTLIFVDDALDLNGELLAASALDLTGANVAGDDVECVDDKGTCSGTLLFVFINLPWHIELELVGTIYKLHFLDGTEEAGKEPTYNSDCNTLIGLQEVLCDGLLFAEASNEAGGVLFKFNSIAEANCSQGGQKTSNLVGEGLLEEAGVTFLLN